MIEKQIHSIWLGNEKIPDEIKAYMKTWSLLEEEGFQVHRWDESNVNMEDVPPVIEAALKYKKYAFVSDYLRLKILYENGGIYLDTDVEVRKDISDTFDEKTTVLLGFIYDTLIGTAVIGARKGEPLIFELMKLYENASWVYEKDTNEFRIVFEMFSNMKLLNNNDVITAYFLKSVPNFTADGRMQKIGSILIYPKEYFEGYSFDKHHNYTIHHCYGSWRSNGTDTSRWKRRLRKTLKKCYFLYAIKDMWFKKRNASKTPFASQKELEEFRD